MEITWLGHACFLLEQDGYRIVTDPYTGVEGYPPLAVEAHAVYCSHGHFDHNAEACVRLLPPRETPFAVREIPCFHDDQHGALRGPNRIRVFTAGGVSVAHLGDLGHALTPELLAQIGTVDGVLVPVGGVYTVDAQGAKAAAQRRQHRQFRHLHLHQHRRLLPGGRRYGGLGGPSPDQVEADSCRSRRTLLHHPGAYHRSLRRSGTGLPGRIGMPRKKTGTACRFIKKG